MANIAAQFSDNAILDLVEGVCRELGKPRWPHDLSAFPKVAWAFDKSRLMFDDGFLHSHRWAEERGLNPRPPAWAAAMGVKSIEADFNWRHATAFWAFKREEVWDWNAEGSINGFPGRPRMSPADLVTFVQKRRGKATLELTEAIEAALPEEIFKEDCCVLCLAGDYLRESSFYAHSQPNVIQVFMDLTYAPVRRWREGEALFVRELGSAVEPNRPEAAKDGPVARN